MGERGTSASHVRVTFPVGEALYALDAIGQKSAEAWERVRKLTVQGAPAVEREIAEMAAVQLDRAHKRLDGALFPNCRWLADEDCTLPVTVYDERGVPYCRVHGEHVRRIRETGLVSA